VLGSEPGIGHPLTRNLDGLWVSRQQGLWIRQFVALLRRGGAVNPQTNARFDVYLARERAGLIEDFQKQPPDIILLDSFSGDWAHGPPPIHNYRPCQNPTRWHSPSTASTFCAETSEAVRAGIRRVDFAPHQIPRRSAGLFFEHASAAALVPNCAT
jgi:hypothetical protein